MENSEVNFSPDGDEKLRPPVAVLDAQDVVVVGVEVVGRRLLDGQRRHEPPVCSRLERNIIK